MYGIDVYEDDDLYTKGYKVLPNCIKHIDCNIAKDLRTKIKSMNVIFNDNFDHRSDKKRLQLSNIAPLFDLPNFGLGYDPEITWNVLYSKRYCQDQAAHIDYELTPLLKKNKWTPDVSHGCIVAVENDTYFNVWPGRLDNPNQKTKIKLDKGDVLIFRADCIHSGSSYQKSNIRIHLYLDNPKRGLRHPYNKITRMTSICEDWKD